MSKPYVFLAEVGAIDAENGYVGIAGSEAPDDVFRLQCSTDHARAMGRHLFAKVKVTVEVIDCDDAESTTVSEVKP